MKTYIKPEIKVKEIVLHNMMLGLSEEEADDSAILSNGRRGFWGNLWDEGEED